METCLCLLHCSIIVVQLQTFKKNYLVWLLLQFLLLFIMCHHPSTCGWYIILVHAPKNGIQQLVSCPLDLPRRKALELCPIYTQNQVQNAHYIPENFLATAWGLFQAKHISCYGTRLFEVERRRWIILTFYCSRWSLPLYMHRYYYCRLGHTL